MKIVMVTPAPAHSRKGNRITAVRWARILRGLGHSVRVVREYRAEPCALLIALHARRSYPSLTRYRGRYPSGPLVLALTGTDLYRDLASSEDARHALTLADRFVTLQALAAGELPPHLRGKVHLIPQSVRPAGQAPPPNQRTFDVTVIGHMRPVKDPFLAAEASRLLPGESRVRILHIGAALDDSMEARARQEMAENPRYRWLGELPRWKARRHLAVSRAMVLSSLMEGGANVISEAIVAGVPVLCSAIPGSTGMLGREYPGYFPVKDAPALATLLRRCETEADYLPGLQRWVKKLAPSYAPEREERAWRKLISELSF